VKRCPKCRATFDGQIRFCGHDGSTLELVPWERPESLARREQLETRVRQAPEDTGQRLELARFLLEIERPAEALVSLYSAKELGCGSVALARLLGEAHAATGEMDRSIPFLQTALDANPADGEAAHWLIVACLSVGKPALLAAYFERWRDSPQGCDALDQLIAAPQVREDPTLAAAAAHALVEGRPGAVNAWRLLAHSEEKLGHRDRSESAYEALLRQRPTDAKASLRLGMAAHLRARLNDRADNAVQDSARADELLKAAEAHANDLDIGDRLLLKLFRVAALLHDGKQLDHPQEDYLTSSALSLLSEPGHRKLFAECALAHAGRVGNDSIRETLLRHAADGAPELGDGPLCAFLLAQANDTLGQGKLALAANLGESARKRFPAETGFARITQTAQRRQRGRAAMKWALGLLMGLLVAAAGFAFYYGRQALTITVAYGQPVLTRFGKEVAATGAKQATTAYGSLPLGPYRVTVEAPGYEKLEHDFWVTLGRNNLDVQLKLVPRCGTLKVATSKPGAKVYVNSTEVGVTPLVWEKCPASDTNAVVWISDATEGFASAILPILPEREIDLGVAPLIKSGITIDSIPTGLTVMLDLFGEDSEVPIGVTPLTHAGLPPKDYVITINEKGSIFSKKVSVIADRITNLGRVACDQAIEVRPGVSLRMVWCEPGEFVMGSRNQSNADAHMVTLTQGFWLGKYEVTEAIWQAAMGSSQYERGRNYPVTSKSWDEISTFISRLNTMVPGGGFSLPTEAEWEYACRAGSTTEYSFGNDATQLKHYAWYSENTQSGPQEVGKKTPNSWGFHDMHGNALEMCQDWYDYTQSTSPEIDPKGPASPTTKVTRGGASNMADWTCKSAARRQDFVHAGFRLARRSHKEINRGRVTHPSVASQVGNPPPPTAARLARSPSGSATVSADLLNLRANPTTESESREKIPNGATVEILESPPEYSPWVRVRAASGVEGWVRSDYLSTADGAGLAPVVVPVEAAEQNEIDNKIRETVTAWDAAVLREDSPALISMFSEELRPYYGKPTAPRALVESDVAKAFAKFSSTRTEISNLRVTALNPDTAYAEFDKEFSGSSETPGQGYACKVAQRLDFRKTNGVWQISGVRELKVYWTDKGSGRVPGNS
jgi:formylglycine-generating enzyme required for sulfatase activity/tetratricopeptide (TPR) repeat protein/ketosteroid isomerase-like protein